MASDPYWGNVVFAAHYDTDFSDLKGHTPTVRGSATISAGDSASFGGGALYVPGVFDDSGVTYSGGDLALGAGDFTIDFFMRQPGSSGVSVIFMEISDGTGNVLHIQRPGGYSDIRMSIYDSWAGVENTITPIGFPIGVRTHFEWGRKGDKNYVFFNGQLKAFFLQQPNYTGTNLRVSGRGVAGYGLYDGYMDDVRITKGVCRHTDTFTAPTSAFASVTKTISGTVLDPNGNPAARLVRAYRRSDGALVGSTVSSGTTGAYSMNCADESEVSLIMLDDEGGTLENDQILRTTPV